MIIYSIECLEDGSFLVASDSSIVELVKRPPYPYIYTHRKPMIFPAVVSALGYYIKLMLSKREWILKLRDMFYPEYRCIIKSKELFLDKFSSFQVSVKKSGSVETLISRRSAQWFVGEDLEDCIGITANITTDMTVSIPDMEPFVMRIGIGLGPISAKKMYELGSDVPVFFIIASDVNYAIRIESTADLSELKVSCHVYDVVTRFGHGKFKFTCFGGFDMEPQRSGSAKTQRVDFAMAFVLRE